LAPVTLPHEARQLARLETDPLAEHEDRPPRVAKLMEYLFQRRACVGVYEGCPCLRLRPAPRRTNAYDSMATGHRESVPGIPGGLPCEMGLQERYGPVELALLNGIELDNALVAHVSGADGTPLDEDPLPRALL
jgi:hypothetical protein